ncbi:hypothetical protein COO60DRAFT_83690 [Scenedesmus sp. NREL 46B-D3]|nr:hypothetical protein COO60DRAFT_83690 [Scenedesmus sp. NREL 46B-D3]
MLDSCWALLRPTCQVYSVLGTRDGVTLGLCSASQSLKLRRHRHRPHALPCCQHNKAGGALGRRCRPQCTAVHHTAAVCSLRVPCRHSGMNRAAVPGTGCGPSSDAWCGVLCMCSGVQGNICTVHCSVCAQRALVMMEQCSCHLRDLSYGICCMHTQNPQSNASTVCTAMLLATKVGGTLGCRCRPQCTAVHQKAALRSLRVP